MSPSRILSFSSSNTRSPVHSLRKLLRHSQHGKPLPALPIVAPKAPIECLPTHVISEIASLLYPRDIFHLGQCSRNLHALFNQALYCTVELRTNKQCKTALITFSKHPELSQHIRRLIVHVNPVEWTGPDEQMDEDLVATLISKLAPQLSNLETFEWDGLEMPRDDLWSALRTNCRYLKRISTTIGEDALSSSSPLWDFDDLRLFSLTVKCQSLDWLSEGPPKIEKLPRKFWAMLLERCPRLEVLKIGGAAPSPRIFDIRHVMSGRWPRLRRITLGDMVLISLAKGEEQAKKDHAGFMAFFTAHPSLRALHLQHAGGSAYVPTTFVLPPKALPNVTSFSGPLKLVKTLPHPHRLQQLTLTTLHHAASSFPPTFVVLQDLKKLESLNIWVDLSFGSYGSLATGNPNGENARGSLKHDDIQILRSLAGSIQNLKSLNISCFTWPTFFIRDFSRVLQTMPNLESFELTKVYKSNEDDMTRSAARIIAENPRIKRFTLRMTCDSWFSSVGGRVKQQGSYEVLGFITHTSTIDDGDSESGTSATSKELPIIPTGTTAVLVDEYGQKSIIGKDYSRYFIHHVLPKTPETPPSSFRRHRHSLSLSRVSSFRTRRSDSDYASDSGACTGGTQSHSRSSSSASSFFKRSRRSSCSVVGSIANAVHTVASPRSSISSVSPSAASHNSVTWAERDQNSNLGRSGSSSSGSGTDSKCYPGDVTQIAIEDDYVII